MSKAEQVQVIVEEDMLAVGFRVQMVFQENKINRGHIKYMAKKIK